MRKRALIWLIAIVLAVILSIMGTIAYLTDVVGVTNVMTVGNVDIELLEYERESVDTKGDGAKVQAFHDDKLLYPAVLKDGFDYSNPTALVDWEQIGWKKNDDTDYKSNIWDPDLINNEVDKMVFVRNTSDYDAYVRIFFAFEAGAYTNLNQFNEKVHLNLNTEDWTWEWEPYIAKIGNEKFFIATATYNTPLKAWTYTEISLSQIALDPSAQRVDVKAFNGVYNVPIFVQAIQSASFDDPETALVTGFGDTIPFNGVTMDRGIDLYTALHYFEGNKAGTKITDKVTSITFATKDEYRAIANDESLVPTLTLNEYDTPTGKEWGAPVHTYYGPNADGNYDLYVLADEGKLYAPKICQNMFADMANLTSVNGTALDVSQTTNMQYMFLKCSKLQKVEASTWNVSNVTNMENVFRNCEALEEIDVSGWRLGKVTSTFLMFGNCKALTTLDVSNWGMSSATSIQSMFESCTSLKTLDVSQWDTTNLQNAQYAFKLCGALESLDVSGWKVDNVTNMLGTFWGCSKLTEIDVSKWNVGNITNMFSTFNGCSSLTSLNVSNWNVDNVTNFNSTFAYCYALTELDLSGWDTSKATNMQSMFDMGKLENNAALTTIYVGDGWTVENVEFSDNMFAACFNLVGGGGKTFDSRHVDANYANCTNGYLTYRAAGTTNP